MASPQFDKFRQLLEANRPPGDEVKVASMRRNLDAVGGRFSEGVTGTPAEVGGVPGEWVADAGAVDDAAVLYLHGGGYVAGSVDSHRNLLGHLARAMGCRLFAADYRLAPEHPHPAPVDDAVAAYRGLVAEHGLEPARLAVAGDSAGGGLTMAALLALRGAGDTLPAAAVTISPWVDLEATGDSAVTRADADPMVTAGSLRTIAELFLGEDGDRRDPLAAPLHADLSGLPPILIQVGDAEVLLDDATRLAAKVEAAGGDATLEVWPEMVHVWHGSAGYVPESDQAIARIGEYLRPRLGLR
ncbi:MAG: alpha/beta hydrolase [Acidimicrobiia bacterium]|nr:alpha/beta hydrolase [Acidimicrobiia bacterium]